VKVLVLGSGGREHALAWKIGQSPLLTGLFCAPGNPGTAGLARNVPLNLDDHRAVLGWVRNSGIDLVVVGPEAPLVKGIADSLSGAGVAVFGPSAAAAALEGSKVFAKEVMAAAGVATPHSTVFESTAEAEAFVRGRGPAVIKADGLAAGKGVIIANNGDEAVRAVRALASLGIASKRLLVEERLEGPELSVIALCDGERYALLPPAQDHKRVGDGNRGPNTGGMGAYAPAPLLDGEGLAAIGTTVIAPMLREMSRRGAPFRGALYAGLMLTPEGPRVLEFNCRLGDPETQALMLILDQDLLPLLASCAKGNLSPRSLSAGRGVSVCVVLAAEGYPQAPRIGDRIEGLDAVGSEATVFHGGTRLEGGHYLTAGGRVLSICASGSTLSAARETAYGAIARLHFRGMHYRRDIGMRGTSLG